MGPRSDNRGYDSRIRKRLVHLPASMGPRSDNRGYARHTASAEALYRPSHASMGPRSDNRGYA